MVVASVLLVARLPVAEGLQKQIVGLSFNFSAVIIAHHNFFFFVNIITKMAYRTRTLRKRKASRRKTSRGGRKCASRSRRGGGVPGVDLFPLGLF